MSLLRALTLAGCVLVLSSSSPAQVSVSSDATARGFGGTVFGLGFTGGTASGVGVSFRTHLPSKSSLQFSFGIIKVTDRLSLSLGNEYQYDLVRGQATRFFVNTALAYFYSGSGGNEMAAPFRAGIGVGGEFAVQEALHVTVEGVFTYFSDGTILPLPQLAVHYYFY